MISTCSKHYLIPSPLKCLRLCVLFFTRTKRYKYMQAAGVFPPCGVQPFQSAVTQPETHTIHCRPVTRLSQNKEHTHCHLREKYNVNDHTESAFSQHITGLHWESVTYSMTSCAETLSGSPCYFLRTLSQVPLWYWTPQVEHCQITLLSMYLFTLS